MKSEHSIKYGETLRKRIAAMSEDSVLFCSDFSECHPEFVGETLAELTNEGILVKLIFERLITEGYINPKI